jgi:GNAT superfamily N-acetyltransferase
MRPDELPFVASGWKRSHRDAPQNVEVAAPAYFHRMGRMLDAVLARRGTTVLVARAPDQSSVLFGFVCTETVGDTLALHYVYTRHSHRRLGVAKALLSHVLDGSGAERLVYTAGSRFDELWERWGFKRVELAEWLRGEAA